MINKKMMKIKACSAGVNKGMKKESNKMNAQSRRIVVVSIDSWLSKLYGGSILDLFSSLLSFGHSVEVLLMSSPSSRVNEKNLSIVTVGLRYSVPMLRYFIF